MVRVALPVLRHRLKFRFGWERAYKEAVSPPPGLSDEDLRDHAIARFVGLCAPGAVAYQKIIDGGLDAALAHQL